VPSSFELLAQEKPIGGHPAVPVHRAFTRA
jgi:hypothetical protein